MSENPLKFNPASQKRSKKRGRGRIVERWAFCKYCEQTFDELSGPCKRTAKCRTKARSAEAERRTAMINTGECFRGWYEHLGPQPIYIESKAQLYNECVKRGLQARCLMSGGVMKRPKGA